ncbi:hypothetical protein [Microbacterium gallinarum]|jgi:hypothetical protein|uniref:Uncharacterized protein n=1 Tax=Microbacterium gallinarum TaxID=2762209 RepID=A0ABR8X2S9_9MICO|nr:hypothetical protein [Microbacterium gallinarum]MBD8023645.1 hypothetical protein [Microbacterium gallinarum]
MDASTFTAYRLEQLRAADLDREHALLVSHREHGGVTATRRSRRRLWPFRRRSVAVTPGVAAPLAVTPGAAARAARAGAPACDPASLALAGPSS